MKAFIVGLGIGIALGVLYAPQAGSKTRADLSEHSDELLSRTEELLDKTKKAAREGFEEASAGS
ncbi:MAG: hypothetical protein NVS1B11_35000 [Terriglobales bacterium]